MVFIIETGNGVRGANTYFPETFVTQYLTERNRQTENGWDGLATALQQSYCVIATDYIDKRFGLQFKGIKQFIFKACAAQAQVNFTGNPADQDTLTIGAIQMTLVAALSSLGQNEVLIGASTADTVQNVIAAMNGEQGAGTTYSLASEQNREASAALVEGSTTDILLTARNFGAAGNDILISEVSTSITIDSQFVNGKDGGSQCLEFPRLRLFDSRGQFITGIPLNLKQAGAEYAVRAVNAKLVADPTVDATGRVVNEKLEKVGPIEERTVYAEGEALEHLIPPYPAADKLLDEYLKPAGGAIRG